VLHEEGLASLGLERDGGLAVRSGRFSATVFLDDRQPHGYRYSHGYRYIDRYGHC
jgi:hypothetical protein